MCFCFFCPFPIVCPCHRKGGVNKRTVNGDKVSQLSVIFGKYVLCFFCKSPKNFHELLKASGIDGLKETTFLDALLGSNMFPCIRIFLKRLNKFPS